MALTLVVVGDPSSGGGAGMTETEEQGFVQKLVPHPAVEHLADAVLLRLPRRDEVPGDLLPLRLCEHGVRGELGAMVADNELRKSVPHPVPWTVGCTMPRVAGSGRAISGVRRRG